MCNTKRKPYPKDLGDNDLSVWSSSTIRNVKKCACVVGDLAEGEVVPVWGQKVYEKLLYFMFNFALNPKLLQKKFIIRIKKLTILGPTPGN